MDALVIIAPRKTGAGRTLKKLVTLDVEELPNEGSDFFIKEFGRALPVYRAVKGDSKNPARIRFRHRLSITEAHQLESQGWKDPARMP